MKSIKTKRLFIILPSLIVIGLLTLFVPNALGKVKSEHASPAISDEIVADIKEAISYAQNDDGGFVELSYIFSDFYYSLHCTYYANKLISNLHNGLPPTVITELHGLLSSIDDMALLSSEDTYDDMALKFYFSELCEMTRFAISESMKNDIIASVLDAQSEMGFFYRSNKERVDYSENRLKYVSGNPMNSVASYMALQILDSFSAIKQCNLDLLMEYLMREYEFLDLDSSNGENLSILAFLLNCHEILSSHDVTIDFDSNFIGSYFSKSLQHFDIDNADVYTISDLSVVYSYLKDTSDNSIDLAKVGESIQQFTYSYSSTFTQSPSSVFDIGFYDSLIMIDNKTGNEVDSVLSDYILTRLMDYKNYDGSYSFNKSDSDIINTYYVMNIAADLNLADIPNSNVDNYIASELKAISAESPLSCIFAIKLERV